MRPSWERVMRAMPAMAAVVVVALHAASTLAGGGSIPRTGRSCKADRARPAISLARLPLSFEENRGQTDPAVRFVSRTSNYTLFLTPTEAVFSLVGGSTGGARGGRAVH